MFEQVAASGALVTQFPFNRPADEVIRKSGLPPSAVSVALLSLEMKRIVRQLPGKVFARNAVGGGD